MQQVRVKTYKEVRGDFDYLFGPSKPSFEPIFDRAQEIPVQGEFAKRFEALKLVPPEHLPWYRITGIRRKDEPGESDRYRTALRKLTPGEGSFILMSMRRRDRAE
jgi:hypothetical protein